MESNVLPPLYLEVFAFSYHLRVGVPSILNLLHNSSSTEQSALRNKN